MLAAAGSLLAAIAGGLWRAGIPLPANLPGPWVDAGLQSHAFLMICTFMGTVIAMERAVALKTLLARAVPVASALAGVAMLVGEAELARWLVVAASAGFIGVNVTVVRRQAALHTALLLVAACAWAAGSMLHALAWAPGAVVAWWFAFLVLTIAAERLEMTRLMQRRAGATGLLLAIVVALCLGAAISAVSATAGGVLYGLALVALGLWLLRHDIARRTVRAEGLPRYMAVCLLLGYGWLVVAGAAWIATALGQPWRDAALHALAIGFVFSMMLAHAPVILPALARVKLVYSSVFYLPLALLHGSLALRVFGARIDAAGLTTGAAGNAAAIGVFAVTMVGSMLAWRWTRRRARIELATVSSGQGRGGWASGA